MSTRNTGFYGEINYPLIITKHPPYLFFWTQIMLRLLLKDQSDQGLQCLLLHLHHLDILLDVKKVNRKVQGVPQSQTAANPWHQEEEKIDRN